MTSVERAALAAAEARGRFELARELHAMLYPEKYPPGTEGHDAEHVYWDGVDLDDKQEVADHCNDPFEWSADTVEWVADLVSTELEVQV
jgi:hypothetical protein